MLIRADYAWLGGPGLTSGVTFAVADGRIDAIIPGSDVTPDTSLTGILLPGLVSAHSHAFHRSLRGKTHGPGGDFWAWREPMYRLAAALTPESYEELAVEVFGEMLRSGITTVGEFHYLHHQEDGSPYPEPNDMGLALVRAAARTGIRLTLIDAAYLASGVDGAPPLPEQARFSDGTVTGWEERVRALAADLADSPVATLAVAAHSVRAVTPEDLTPIAEVAEDLDVPLHVHLSEQRGENEDCLATHGVTPTELLASAGFLAERTTVVHGTHTTERDRELISSTGAGVCLCPTTEADLGDGIGPAAEYRASGVPLSLGSDSNAVIDIFEEGRRVEHHDRLRLGRRGVHAPVDLLESATGHGMRALGWRGGSLAVGSPADLVVLDADSDELRGMDAEHALATIVFAATRASVRDVFVNGQQVVRDRRLAVTG